jgi:hypothetical protein
MGSKAEVRFPIGITDFSLHPSVQVEFGAHPGSYTMSTGVSFPRGKAVGV